MHIHHSARTVGIVGCLVLAACKDADPPAGTGDDTGSGGISATQGPTTDPDGTTSTSATDPTGTTDTPTSGEPTESESSAGPTGDTTASDPTTETTDPSTTEPAEDSTAEDPGTTTEDVVPCDVARATLEPVPPNIMLVLDKSGSMVDNTWDHDLNGGTPEVTRWNSLFGVVDFVTSTFDEQINFGAMLFPAVNATNAYNATACVVGGAPDIPVAPNNAAAIIAGIPSANELNIDGGTPAAEGVSVALEHLLAQDPSNPRAMILVTDGAANCASDAANNTERFEVYDEQLQIVVGDAWTDEGIPTYVVGIDVVDAFSNNSNDGVPNSTNTYDELNEVATLGGQPLPGNEQFYQTTNEAELQDALEAIIANALSCVVPLDPEPAFPELLQVIISDMNVPQVLDCASEDGWVYSNPGGPYDSIELCGLWCDELKATGSVTAEYYCDPG
jgi:hypothetical protein